MKTLAQQFLTDEEQEQVRISVRRAEARTSGEIVPLVTSWSHEYPGATLRAAISLALLPAIALAYGTLRFFWLPGDALWLFLLYMVLLIPLAQVLVNRIAVLKRFFLARDQCDLHVERSAFIEFFAGKLHKTRDQNGVLLYISVLERKVWIIGDRGINEKIDPDSWKQIIDELVHGIRRQQPGEAICVAIDKVADILEKHFPLQPDDTNELSDLVIKSSGLKDSKLIVC